jgi:Uma2 family endonuclease
MYAVSGASRNHGRIVASAGAQLYAQLPGNDCEAANDDLRLAVRQHNLITYPDIFVTCGPDKFLDHRTDTLVDATVIIEVLSPSTMNWDRGEKSVSIAPCRRFVSICFSHRTKYWPSTMRVRRTVHG